MKVSIINEDNDWGVLWTDAKKAELKKGETNRTVGKHMVLENDRVRIWSIFLQPGESVPFHKHNTPYFFITVSAGKSRAYYSTGKITETVYDLDDYRYFGDLSEDNYFIHNLENIGDTVLAFTTVELLW